MPNKQERRLRRHTRIRTRISGTSGIPRLSVFRSDKHIYAQLIDDEKSKIVAAASDLEPKKARVKKKKIDIAKEVGKIIAQKAKDLKIEKVVFDRGGYKYHGRVKAVAEGARETGLKF